MWRYAVPQDRSLSQCHFRAIEAQADMTLANEPQCFDQSLARP
ncbi:hypothetical protein [Sphingomonas sp. VDB2]